MFDIVIKEFVDILSDFEELWMFEVEKVVINVVGVLKNVLKYLFF